MITAKELLIEKGSHVISTRPDTTIQQAVQKMTDHNIGCLIVEHHERIIGIFSERDLLRRVISPGKDIYSTIVLEVMTSPVKTCPPDASILEMMDIFSSNHIRHVLVMDNGSPLGLVSIRDVAIELRKCIYGHEFHWT